MELDNNTDNLPGCSRPMKGCMVTIGIALIGLMALLFYASRMPAVREIVQCRDNMTQIGAAIGRYHDVNGTYPADLLVLKKEYIKDQSILRCPLDKSPGNAPSYSYHKPVPGSRGHFAMLECDRHRMSKEIPPYKMIFRKDGSLEIKNPVLQRKTKK